jgi:hypothetical protein
MQIDESIIYGRLRVELAGVLAKRHDEKSSGVYAWHLPPPTEKARLDITGINQYYSALSNATSTESAKTARSHVNISLNTTPIKPSENVTEAELVIREFIGVAGLFASPIYVGSTTDQSIPERIRQHLSSTRYGKDLMYSIQKSGYSDNVYPEVMIVRYLPIDEILKEFDINLTAAGRCALIEQIEETIFAIRLPVLNRKRSR